MIESGNLNPLVAESIMIILGIAMKDKSVDVSSVVMGLMKSEYMKWAVEFLLEILSDPWLLAINILADDSPKKPNETPKYSYKISSDSMSIQVSNCLKALPEEDYVSNHNASELISQAREDFTVGGVCILEVTLCRNIETLLTFPQQKCAVLRKRNAGGEAPQLLSLIHICRCRRYAVCRSRWSPYH
eukprot:TRINITY_DN26735_c0_g2_i1.p1 TRINITY_DN26735_c0_g2~~TRINITY_DN26735_c0_g2_i1.p1  ORF type:complete len:187 (+),score=36.34 TRINITY_DN26735_c0_g2_i1:150-710(+)